uniref:Uncharacterized protein n=1 Tax=Caenorhabditis japonica TaxID=281687 RepID=A0A8R1DGK7_CAEJA
MAININARVKKVSGVPRVDGSVEMSLAVQMSLVELRATGRIRVRATGWTRVALAAPSSKTSAPSQN